MRRQACRRATTAANALATGEVDFWEGASPDLLDYVRKRGMTVPRNNALPSVAFVRPNFQHKPFSDPRARMALALLVDQEEMMQSFAGDGAWSKCYSFSICGSPFGTEAGSDAVRKPDVARARALLAEAGYQVETLVLLGTPTLAPINAMAQVLAERLNYPVPRRAGLVRRGRCHRDADHDRAPSASRQRRLDRDRGVRGLGSAPRGCPSACSSSGAGTRTPCC